MQFDYPIYSDLINDVERINPHCFDYFCLHGKQCFIVRLRGRYRVFCSTHIPVLDLDNSFSSYKFYGYWYVQYIETTDFFRASEKYEQCCRELLRINEVVFQ